jgi:hypothetical protein
VCEDFLFLVNFHVVFPTSGKGLLKIRIFSPNNASFSAAFPDPSTWHVACSPSHTDGGRCKNILQDFSSADVHFSQKRGDYARTKTLHDLVT